MNKIELKSDGKFYRYEYNHEFKTLETEIETSLIPYLNYEFVIESGVLFEQLFSHILKFCDEYNIVFASQLGQYDLNDWSKEFNLPFEYSSELDYLEVYHSDIDLSDSSLVIFDSFHGIGNYNLNDKLYTKCGIAVEYCSINQLKGYEFKLNNSIKIHKFDSGEFINLYESKKNFSVYDVIGAILYEISWNGNPKTRDEQRKNLVEMSDKIYNEILN